MTACQFVLWLRSIFLWLRRIASFGSISVIFEEASLFSELKSTSANMARSRKLAPWVSQAAAIVQSLMSLKQVESPALSARISS